MQTCAVFEMLWKCHYRFQLIKVIQKLIQAGFHIVSGCVSLPTHCLHPKIVSWFWRIMTDHFQSQRPWGIFQIKCGTALTKPVSECGGGGRSWQLRLGTIPFESCLCLTGKQSRLCCSVVKNSSCSFTLMTHLSRRKREGVCLGTGWWYRSVQVILSNSRHHLIKHLAFHPVKKSSSDSFTCFLFCLLHSGYF